MLKLALWHPFSPHAVGLNEETITQIHSRPHINAMRELQSEGWQTSTHYLSMKHCAYKVAMDGLTWCFWPTLGREHRYRKEYSVSALWNMLTAPPDVTIINVSGYGSRFARHLALACRVRGRAYIAMIGGVGLTLDRYLMDYYLNAACIITHTRGQKEQVERMLGLSEGKVVVMPLGIETSQFTPPQVLPSMHELHLLFVGRWQELKGIHHALAALQQIRGVFPNARLTLVGPQSDPDYTTSIMAKIGELGLMSHVDILGPLPYDELVHWYQQAHFLLLPSEPGKESFGMVMVESLACGTPVIALAATTGGAAEIISHHIDGILTQPEQMANDILQIFGDSTRYQRMRLEAREKALKQYSLSVTTQALRQALRIAMKVSTS